jgi:ferredoxin
MQAARGMARCFARRAALGNAPRACIAAAMTGSDDRQGRLIVRPFSVLGWRHARERRAMKVRIDKAACVGNARCAAVAEALFPLDDDGYIAIDEFTVAEGQEKAARNGARACPERIIAVIEDDGTQSWPPAARAWPPAARA